MNKNSHIKVRPMLDSDLELVLGWRNHSDVRRYMYSQHEITMAEHSRWFERVSQNSNYHLLIFESNANPLGFINIHRISEGEVADWGFYAAPGAPKGTGKQLGQASLHYAFTTAGLHKICGQALSYNEPSIRFHLRLGFQEEGRLREQHFDGHQYHDIVCFGLLSSEWNKNREG